MRETDTESRLADALDQFSKLQELGKAPSRAAFIALYPDIADELDAYLPLVQYLGRMGPTSDCSQETIDPAMPELADFRISRQVGQGGMGIVYEALQISLNRRVALKVLSRLLVNDPKSLVRFNNEVQATALLEHPHIVNVLGVGSERGIHYYTMRFIEGNTLAEVFRSVRGQFESTSFRVPSTLKELARSTGDSDTVEEVSAGTVALPAGCDQNLQGSQKQFSKDYFRVVAQLGAQAADALHHAHMQGVIHRDIKPSNLMLDNRGHLWVTDFGLARIESSASLTLTGDLIGTLRYMSPEQLLALPTTIDHRCDIYSLGATLYEMTILKPMIDGATCEDVMFQVVKGKVFSPRRLQAQLPRDLETIVLKTVAKDRNDRYASCRELADDLQRFLDRRPILARRPSLALRCVRWAQRNPHLSTVSILFVVLTSIITSFSVWWIDASRRNAIFEKTQRQQQEQLVTKAMEDTATHEAVSLTIRAAQAWRNKDFSMLSRLMESTRETPENSSLERRILRHISDAQPTVLAKHGTTLATVGEDGQLLLFRTSDWTRIGARRVEGSLVSVGFSAPLGLIVACERNDRGIGYNALHIWDATNETIHSRLHGPTDQTEGLSVSSDGNLAAVVCRDGLVYVWDLKQQTLLHRLSFNSSISDSAHGSAVAFGHQSPILAACARDGSIRVFNGLTGESLPNLESDIDFPEAVAFSPDDSVLGIGFRKGMTRFYELHHPNRWLLTNEFIHQQGLWGVHFSRDRMLYTSGHEGRIECWDYGLPMDRRRIKLLSVEENRALIVESNPAIRASNWNPNRVYERAASFQTYTSTQQSYSNAIAIEPSLDGKRIAINSCNTHLFQVVDSITGAPVSKYAHNAEYATRQIFSADSKSILMCGHPKVFVSLDALNMSELKKLSLADEGSLHSISYSSDQTRLYLVFGEPLHHRIKKISSFVALDSATFERKAFAKNLPSLSHRSLPLFSSEALQYLVERHTEPMAVVIHKQIATGQVLWIGCSDARDVFVCAFEGGVIQVFRDADLEHPSVIHLGVGRCSYAISPDGTLLAVCPLERYSSHASDTLSIYHTSTGRELMTLRYYLIEPWEVRFSRDGRKLMVVGNGITNIDELVIWGDD